MSSQLAQADCLQGLLVAGSEMVGDAAAEGVAHSCPHHKGGPVHLSHSASRLSTSPGLVKDSRPCSS